MIGWNCDTNGDLADWYGSLRHRDQSLPILNQAIAGKIEASDTLVALSQVEI